MKWNIENIIQATQAETLSVKEKTFNQVSFDTRDSETLSDSVFFALKGQSDGHLYLEEAAKKARVLVIDHLPSSCAHLKNKITLLKVPDTTKALQEWATHWRKTNSFKVVAVTGSTGKTSAKHFCELLFKNDSTICVSPQSYNNHLGVALGLLSTNSKTSVLIQEIGTNSSGEVKTLCRLAHPDISVCTTVGPSHLKNLKNIENVFLEKNDIYEKASLGIFNLDNPWTLKMKEQFSKTQITFSEIDPTADVYLKVQNSDTFSLTLTGHIQGKKGSVKISVVGRHCVTSILTAISIGISINKKPEDIWNRLHLLKNPPNRLEWKSFGNVKVLFDAYNSNPASVKAFLEYIKVLKKPCVLCLGDMLDLGETSSQYHEQMGQLVSSLNLRYIFFIGKYRLDFEKGLTTSTPYKLYENFSKEAGKEISSILKPNDVFALKASRGMQFERLLEFIGENSGL